MDTYTLSRTTLDEGSASRSKGKSLSSTYSRPQRARGGVELQLYSIFNFGVVGGRRSKSLPGLFNPGRGRDRERGGGVHFVVDWVGPRNDME
jgi:hypothetical protein